MLFSEGMKPLEHLSQELVCGIFAFNYGRGDVVSHTEVIMRCVSGNKKIKYCCKKTI